MISENWQLVTLNSYYDKPFYGKLHSFFVPVFDGYYLLTLIKMWPYDIAYESLFFSYS